MRLLVSVRSAAEVAAALAGGADIIDVKEPARGALGAADPEVILAVARRLPPAIPLSVALGDPREPGAAVRRLTPRRRTGEVILKMGFAGGTAQDGMVDGLRAALDEAGHVGSPAVVAVAYADHARALAPSPIEVLRTAALSGADGILIDTFLKDGRDLFASISYRALQEWVAEARASGLRVAVAGSLGREAVARVGDTGPDVVGVRGAACEGGRLGRISAALVGELVAALAGTGSHAGDTSMPGSSPARSQGSRV